LSSGFAVVAGVVYTLPRKEKVHTTVGGIMNKFETHPAESLESVPERQHIDGLCNVSCIVCGTKLAFAGPTGEAVRLQPYNGLVCFAPGNYGSTLFDPSGNEGGQRLVFIICDNCMRERSDRVVLETTTHGTTSYGRLR
jgi:hypothetical protein